MERNSRQLLFSRSLENNLYKYFQCDIQPSSILRIKNHRFRSQFWKMRSLSFKLIAQPDLVILKNSMVAWEKLWVLRGHGRCTKDLGSGHTDYTWTILQIFPAVHLAVLVLCNHTGSLSFLREIEQKKWCMARTHSTIGLKQSWDLHCLGSTLQFHLAMDPEI